MLTTASVLFVLLGALAVSMSIRSLFSFSGTTRLRSSTPTAVDIQHDRADEMLKYKGSDGTVYTVEAGKLKTLTPTAAVALTAEQSGSDVWLNAAEGFAITLPAPAAGLNYRFTVAAAFATTSFTVVTNGGSNIIQGGATVAGADVPAADEDTITFVNTVETKGDFVDVWSDGTSWFVNGRGTTAGSITFTAT